MEYKKLTYAYYSSPHAHRYNKGLECWLVQHDVFVDVFQDAERYDALAYFESINLPVHPIESFTKESLPFRE